MSIVIVNNSFFNVFEKKSLNHLQILVFVHIFASEFYLLVRERTFTKFPYTLFILYIGQYPYIGLISKRMIFFYFFGQKHPIRKYHHKIIYSYRLTNMLRWQNLK